MLVPTLPKPLQVEWEMYTKESKGVPHLDELSDFLKLRAKVLASYTSVSVEQPPRFKPAEVKVERAPRKYRAAVHAATPRSSSNHSNSSNSSYSANRPNGFRYECILCPGSKHPLFQCEVFREMSIQGREDHIRNKNLCNNCLAPGHMGKDCRSWARCRNCGGKHHTLVHGDRRPPAAVNVVAANNNQSEQSVSINVASVGVNQLSEDQSTTLPNCLMMTSKVSITGPGGRQMVARALLDSGASMSLISSKLAKSLQLPKHAILCAFQVS